MVFSVVSDWMFKPVERIEDQAAEILAQQGGVKPPVLGLEMQTAHGGGPERFGSPGQVDVLAYDGKKMGRLVKDLRVREGKARYILALAFWDHSTCSSSAVLVTRRIGSGPA